MVDTTEKNQRRFTDHSELSDTVLDVHCEHLSNHPIVEEYESAGEYFEREIGASDVAEGFYEMPVYSIFRIHTYAPRNHLILQKNPDLPSKWIESNVHWSYEDLSGGINESVLMNSLQTAKTHSGYFNKTDTVRLGLKCIIDAVRSELDCDLDANPLHQSDFEEYIQLSASQAYRGNREGEGADLSDGFQDDFAYTNVCKFQAQGSGAEPSDADEEWLADELNAVAPKVVFALGGAAYQGLRNIGFEKTGNRSQYSDGNSGRILRYSGDRPGLNGTYAVHLYHLDYRQRLKTDRDVHDALSIVAQELDS